MAGKVPITVAHGDGIGPEIMDATLKIITAAGAQLDIDTIEIGESVYKRGFSSGIEPKAWESLRRTKVFLKAPITTPQGGGVKSLNVTVRNSLGLYANIRPVRSYDPFISTKHPHMDMVIIRENEEDVYSGIEHQQTDDVVQCLKLISRPGCERIIRYAFEYCRSRKRKKLTLLTKDNIMKMTDGLFHKVFDEISVEYADVDKEHMIVDIGMAKVADYPESFDVIVVPNLYGDILSDIVAEMSGSVGMVGSSNVGENHAMFEAIHGSAPDIAGKKVANPSGLLRGAIMMLAHIGQTDVAENVYNAWLKTIEEGIHTPDIFNTNRSIVRVNTDEFTDAVIERLGQEPEDLKAKHYSHEKQNLLPYTRTREEKKKDLVGIDVFVHEKGEDAEALAAKMKAVSGPLARLTMISNRGVKVWPEGFPETFFTDHWRCRFKTVEEGGILTHQDIAGLLSRLADEGVDFIKTEHLYNFDGEPGYSLGHGE